MQYIDPQVQKSEIKKGLNEWQKKNFIRDIVIDVTAGLIMSGLILLITHL